MKIHVAIILLCLGLAACHPNGQAMSRSDEFGQELEDLVDHVEVKDQDGNVIIDRKYDPPITKAQSLVEIKTALEAKYTLVTDEHLSEVDADHFVLTIAGIKVHNDDQNEVEDRWRVIIEIGSFRITFESC